MRLREEKCLSFTIVVDEMISSAREVSCDDLLVCLLVRSDGTGVHSSCADWNAPVKAESRSDLIQRKRLGVPMALRSLTHRLNISSPTSSINNRTLEQLRAMLGPCTRSQSFLHHADSNSWRVVEEWAVE